MNEIDCTGMTLSGLDGAMRVVKRPVEVRVIFAGADGVLATLEGDVRYRAGDALVEGEHHDRWPVDREQFEADYLPVDVADHRYVKRALQVWAKPMDRPFRVRAGRANDLLRGDAGDWLVEYRPGDYGIVQGDVFDATYAFCP